MTQRAKNAGSWYLTGKRNEYRADGKDVASFTVENQQESDLPKPRGLPA